MRLIYSYRLFEDGVQQTSRLSSYRACSVFLRSQVRIYAQRLDILADVLRGFRHIFQEYALLVSHINVQPFPSISFPIHKSRIIL
jgi:hypothetical protein